MVKSGFLAMTTDRVSSDLLESDLKELGIAARRLADHAFVLGAGFGFGSTFFKFLASLAAIYLLVLDRTNWKTKMLTSLLIPYIFLSLPHVLFNILRGEIGTWIAFVAVVLRLFFPKHYPAVEKVPKRHPAHRIAKEFLEVHCWMCLRHHNISPCHLSKQPHNGIGIGHKDNADIRRKDRRRGKGTCNVVKLRPRRPSRRKR